MDDSTTIAEQILFFNNLWETTCKSLIADRVEKHLWDIFPECKSLSRKIEKIEEITGSTKHTIYSWFNRSREDVKIPFLKLCMISVALNVDIKEFLKQPIESA